MNWRTDKTTSAQRGYGYQWQKVRKQFLMDHPLCAYCLQTGHATPATVVDHIIPHRGDPALFWDESNWQSLCKLCHDSVKARHEQGKQLAGCSTDGTPVDAAHHWHGSGGEGVLKK